MSSTPSVLKFPGPNQKRPSAAPETAPAPPASGTQTHDEGLATVRVEGATALAPISIDILYSATDGNRSDLIKALGLLAQAISTLERARDALVANDLLQSDHFVHTVELLLPDLFRCRSIGDGYAAIINALEIARVNSNGQPLTASQVVVFLRALKELRTHPFVSFDAAQQTIEEFEQAGLCVDPVSLGELLDDEEQGVR